MYQQSRVFVVVFVQLLNSSDSFSLSNVGIMCLFEDNVIQIGLLLKVMYVCGSGGRAVTQ